jgi:hypothetical protein
MGVPALRHCEAPGRGRVWAIGTACWGSGERCGDEASGYELETRGSDWPALTLTEGEDWISLPQRGLTITSYSDIVRKRSLNFLFSGQANA